MGAQNAYSSLAREKRSWSLALSFAAPTSDARVLFCALLPPNARRRLSPHPHPSPLALPEALPLPPPLCTHAPTSAHHPCSRASRQSISSSFGSLERHFLMPGKGLFSLERSVPRLSSVLFLSSPLPSPPPRTAPPCPTISSSSPRRLPFSLFFPSRPFFRCAVSPLQSSPMLAARHLDRPPLPRASVSLSLSLSPWLPHRSTAPDDASPISRPLPPLLFLRCPPMHASSSRLHVELEGRGWRRGRVAEPRRLATSPRLAPVLTEQGIAFLSCFFCLATSHSLLRPPNHLPFAPPSYAIPSPPNPSTVTTSRTVFRIALNGENGGKYKKIEKLPLRSAVVFRPSSTQACVLVPQIRPSCCTDCVVALSVTANARFFRHRLGLCVFFSAPLLRGAFFVPLPPLPRVPCPLAPQLGERRFRSTLRFAHALRSFRPRFRRGVWRGAAGRARPDVSTPRQSPCAPSGAQPGRAFVLSSRLVAGVEARGPALRGAMSRPRSGARGRVLLCFFRLSTHPHSPPLPDHHELHALRHPRHRRCPPRHGCPPDGGTCSSAAPSRAFASERHRDWVDARSRVQRSSRRGCARLRPRSRLAIALAAIPRPPPDLPPPPPTPEPWPHRRRPLLPRRCPLALPLAASPLPASLASPPAPWCV